MTVDDDPIVRDVGIVNLLAKSNSQQLPFTRVVEFGAVDALHLARARSGAQTECSRSRDAQNLLKLSPGDLDLGTPDLRSRDDGLQPHHSLAPGRPDIQV